MTLSVRKASLLMLTGLSLTLYPSCSEVPQNKTASTAIIQPATKTETTAEKPVALNTPTIIADAATILARREVPILCYHQIRDYKPTDGKIGRPYIVPPADFAQQMQALADSGYHTILPDQLNEYLTTGKELPSKPVMLTFDDTRLDQYTAALPELNKHGFKGVFFIMTVSLGRPGYMSKEQVKELSDKGHTIGSHTWDHKNVKTYTDTDWPVQIAKPSKQLQEITGKPIEYFAYPFGLWNKEAIPHLKEHGFKGVFQLYAKRDENDPLFTIRRIIVPDWSGAGLIKTMKNTFK
jgi:peptidoglycan/xylan/chitin deacetylase (PgdA/CDA1 family)